MNKFILSFAMNQREREREIKRIQFMSLQVNETNHWEKEFFVFVLILKQHRIVHLALQYQQSNYNKVSSNIT